MRRYEPKGNNTQKALNVITGLEPTGGFVCNVSQCGPGTNYDVLLEDAKQLFDKDNFCEMRPLRTNFDGGACSPSSFNLTAETVTYCKNYQDVTYGPSYMTSSIVTEFGLICSREYLVSSILF